MAPRDQFFIKLTDVSFRGGTTEVGRAAEFAASVENDPKRHPGSSFRG